MYYISSSFSYLRKNLNYEQEEREKGEKIRIVKRISIRTNTNNSFKKPAAGI
jgi:hypothetical protein